MSISRKSCPTQNVVISLTGAPGRRRNMSSALHSAYVYSSSLFGRSCCSSLGFPSRLRTGVSERFFLPHFAVRSSTMHACLVAMAAARSDLGVSKKNSKAGLQEGATSAQKTSLVIVESPSKAVTIGNILPSNIFKVEYCAGHIRDLPSSAKQIPAKYKDQKWSRLGVDVDDDFRPLYVTVSGKQKIIRHLKAVLKDCDELILATDDDREGEAIAWHLFEVLQPTVPVRRAVFSEITKDAISRSFESFRDLDRNMIEAQETRRVIDRLAGYTVSPVLWTTIAPKLSAGRVQSVALSLVVKREKERLRFRSSEFWEAEVLLRKDGHAFNSRLVAVDGKQLARSKDFDHTTGSLRVSHEGKTSVAVLSKEAILDLFYRARQNGSEPRVEDIRKSPVTRSPPKPLITSTLQQEAFSKLRLSAGQTMRIAQSLYEEGLITYMRTDNPNLSKAGRVACEQVIESRFGKEYVGDLTAIPAGPNAQWAHEAIRPSGSIFVHPDESGLTPTSLALYDLIYKRTIASQMRAARLSRTSIDISFGNMQVRASGSIILFPGFLGISGESQDSQATNSSSTVISLLPDLTTGDLLELVDVTPVEHHTQPPPRYNDGSLVKELDQLGIGRPSTYASIVETLMSRGYAQRTKSRAIAPNLVSFAVDTLLSTYIPSLVSTDFTAEMESNLDRIELGRYDRLTYLKGYYHGKRGLKCLVEDSVSNIDHVTVKRVDLSKLFGRDEISRNEPNVMVGPYGPYLEHGGKVLANLPKDTLADELAPSCINDIVERAKNPVIGQHTDGTDILLKSGRYGPYFQLGHDNDAMREAGTKPRRVKLLPGMDMRDIDIRVVQKLLLLPRNIGVHPVKNVDVVGSIGRLGPYIHCDGTYVGVESWESLLYIDLEEAVRMIDEKIKRKKERTEARREMQTIYKTRRTTSRIRRAYEGTSAIRENQGVQAEA